MGKTDYQIIFDKLAEASAADGVSPNWVVLFDASREELDEIAELARLSKELAEPDAVCYTTT